MAKRTSDAKRLQNLRVFNMVMGALHLVQGILMLLLSSDFSLPVMTSFLEFDVETTMLVPNPEVLFDLRVGPLVAAFLLMSAAAHWIISLPRVFDWYAKHLKNGANYARWIEYAFSSSVMMLAIAMLAGIYDVVALLLMFFLNAAMILFGWAMERHNQLTKKTDWTSFVFGSIVGIVPWVAIAIYLFGAGGGEMGPPDFVYWIFFTIFLTFNTFALNMLLQYKKVGKWEDYLYGERAYIILSLVAKSLLAWQVWGGTLRPV